MRTWLKAYRTEGLAGLRHTPQPGRPPTKRQYVAERIEQRLAHSPSHFGSMADGWTVARIRDYLAQHHEAGSDATVRCQRQAGHWVYKRFATTIPRDAPTAEQKKRGWQQLSPPLAPAKRNGP